MVYKYSYTRTIIILCVWTYLLTVDGLEESNLYVTIPLILNLRQQGNVRVDYL